MKFAYGLMSFVLLAAAPVTAAEGDATIVLPTKSPYYVTGEQLLRMCTATETESNGPDMCEAYIAGVIDTVISNRDVIQGYHICWPQPASSGAEMRELMVKYLKAHPEYGTGIAASIVDSFLFETYACPGARPPPESDFQH